MKGAGRERLVMFLAFMLDAAVAMLITLIVWMILTATGCTNVHPSPPDGGIEVPDGEPDNPCCLELPDEDAVRSCLLPSTTPNTCGVLVCHDADGSRHRINFCGPR